MNWDASDAVAELVAALVVVVTLLYLLTEFRENTRALRRTSADSALLHVLEFTGDMGRIRELEELVTQGIEGWDSVPTNRWLATLHRRLDATRCEALAMSGRTPGLPVLRS